MAPLPGLAAQDPAPADGETFFEDFESGLVGIFADLAELFGNPRSYGQIYGLLFAREEPMTMEEIARRLEMSQGSVSQGLRQLEAFGAVTKEKSNGSRQALYTAKLEMKLLISGFLKERVIPRLESTEARVEELRASLNSQPSVARRAAAKQSQLVPSLPNSAFRSQPSSLASIRFRLDRVAKWHRSARTILPIARKILGGG